ncbi:hypothetical protein D3C73_1229780 [compost metagenome]
MIASAAAHTTYTAGPRPSSSGICARKISMASALTKPVMTERETKRINEPSLNMPATTCSRPARMLAANRYCRP